MSSPRLAQVGVSLMFFTNGALVASILPRLPEVKEAFALSNTQFGLMVIAMPVGSIMAAAAGGAFVRRFGARTVTAAGSILLGALIALAGFAPTPVLFALPFVLAGFTDAVVDAAQNIQGVTVEEWRGRSIINSLHALWSLGAATGGSVAAWSAAMGLPLGPQLAVTGALWASIAVVASLIAGTPHDGQPPATAAEGTEAGSPTRPAWRLLLPIALLAICGTLIEDIANNWVTLFLTNEAGATIGLAGMGYTVVLLSQFVGRILGDPMTDRWGRGAVARLGGVLVAIGAVTVATAPGVLAPYLGFALTGFGCATLVPAAFAAAARIPGFAHGSGVALLGWLMRLGFLGTSPLIGVVSDAVGLRLAMMVPVAAGLTAALIAHLVWRAKRDSAALVGAQG